MKSQFVCEIDTENNTTRFFIPSIKGLSGGKIKKFLKFLLGSKFEVEVVNKLSVDQMKLIWVLCREYGELIGYERDDMKEILQSEFCSKRGFEDFSISPRKRNAASMELATEFIQFIIEHAISAGYNLILHEGRGENRKVRSAREVVPDIRRWVLAHLLNKRCCICGKRAQLHHEPPLGSIGYEHDTGLITGFLPLCGDHHAQRHGMTWKEFKEMWHIQEVWLSENIVENLLKVYPGHFKGYRKLIKNR